MSDFPVVTTSGMQAGVSAMNSVPAHKFPLVLTRVSQCIQERPHDLQPFSSEEQEKLGAKLGLDGAALRLMLDCCTLILKQAAFNITKPAVLQQQLSDYKLNDDKVEAFVSSWTSQAKNIVGALKRKSVYPKQVEGVSWLLNAAVSSSDTGPIMEPRAVVELKLHSEDNTRGNLRLDLDPTQLLTLYDTLETIQTRLDNLR